MLGEKCLFLDRDGVMIHDVHLLQKEKDITLVKGIVELIRIAVSRGYKIIMVTNQTVVSRGLLSFDETINLNDKVIGKVFSQLDGLKLDAFYLCPHHPSATLEEFRLECDCRKPRPGMLLKAAKDHNIDLLKSYFIGDRVSDVIAGNLAECRTILLKSDEDKNTLIESSLTPNKKMKTPDFIINSLEEAQEIIL